MAAMREPNSPWYLPQAAEESPAHSFLTLVPAKAPSLAYSHSSLWLQMLLCNNFSLSLTCYHRDAATITGGLNPGLLLILEPAGTGSVQQERNFWYLLTEGTPVAPCHQNLARQIKHRNNCNFHKVLRGQGLFLG